MIRRVLFPPKKMALYIGLAKGKERDKQRVYTPFDKSCTVVQRGAWNLALGTRGYQDIVLCLLYLQLITTVT